MDDPTAKTTAMRCDARSEEYNRSKTSPLRLIKKDLPLRRQGRRAVSVLGRVACRPSDLPVMRVTEPGTATKRQRPDAGCCQHQRCHSGDMEKEATFCSFVATKSPQGKSEQVDLLLLPAPQYASTIVGGTGTTREKREHPHCEATGAAAFTVANKRKHGSLGAQSHKVGVGYSALGSSPRRWEARVGMIEAASTCKRDPCLCPLPPFCKSINLELYCPGRLHRALLGSDGKTHTRPGSWASRVGRARIHVLSSSPPLGLPLASCTRS
jgi:hypothetical protein